MDTATQTRLIFTDLANNNNKFWHGSVVGNDMVTEWGRIGEAGQTTRKSFPSQEKAQKALDGKIREKLGKGYTRQHTTGDAAVVAGGTLASVAQAQINHKGDPETRKLIDFLAARNIHTIEGATGIRLQAGVLTTPLGPVTSSGLDEANLLLAKIGGLVADRQPCNPSYVNAYLRIIPRSIGRRRVDPCDVFPNTRAITKEFEVLDALRAVLSTAASAGNVPEVFDTKLTLLDKNDPEFKRIDALYRKTLNARHTSASMRLVKVWAVSVGPADKAFEGTLTNKQELWHGTKDANLLSILKGGFVIPKRGGTAQITGRMFGDGIYFSNQSTKSLNYATGFWGGGSSNRAFMLLNEVAMGKSYRPARSFSGTPPKGYDSTDVKAGTAGVHNHEAIVYRASQCRPTFLCEFA